MSESNGLREAKYEVNRLYPSSKGTDHSDCRYFVLDPKHDPSARHALLMYARDAHRRGNKLLALDITDWLIEIWMETLRDGLNKTRERLYGRVRGDEDQASGSSVGSDSDAATEGHLESDSDTTEEDSSEQSGATTT